MNFVKNILASIIGFWIALVIFIVIAIAVIARITSEKVVAIKANSILEISINAELKDYVSSEGSQLEQALGLSNQIGFNQILEAIQLAKFDDKIKVISIKKLPINLGWAQASELRDALLNFKQSGKSVWAYADFYNQKDYYVASMAHMVTLSPVGAVDLKGIHSEVLFFKDFQDKYGVKMEVIRHGKYKSAVEPFIANNMSEANRTQISELVQSIWKKVKSDIESSRKINTETTVTNLGGRLPQLALTNKLIDQIAYEDDYYNQIKASISEDAKIISFEDYVLNNFSALLPIKSDRKIAVIYAQGEIIYGEGNENKVGQGLMIKSIEEAVKDKEVKAIVLRIDSPGGSALASDLIWNALEKAKQEKPVIVSMGNLAASGGYYIACNASRIFAEPTTITGSIGVFGILPNAAEISKKNGISAEVVSTHNNAAHYSLVKPLNSKFKNTVQEGIEFVYDTFLDRVATGRNFSIATADSLAQGRVWSGSQALANGLVDELGGLKSAVTYAATLTQTNNYSIEEFPKYKMNFKELIGGPLIKSLQPKNILSSSKQVTAKIKYLESILKMKGAQARIPFDMVIE